MKEATQKFLTKDINLRIYFDSADKLSFTLQFLFCYFMQKWYENNEDKYDFLNVSLLLFLKKIQFWHQCKDWNLGGYYYLIHKQNYTLTKPNDAIRKFYSHLSEFLTHKRRSRVSIPCICLECHPGLLLLLNICVLFSLKDVSFGLPKEKGVISYSIM